MTGASKSTRAISRSLDPFTDGVIYGVAWDGAITYSFPASSGEYTYTAEPSANFDAANAQQQSAMLFAIEQSAGTAANDGFSVEGFTKATFSAGSNSTATLRLGQSDAPDTAHAFLPGTYEQAGDIWLGRNFDLSNAVAGNYAWHTLLHEIGHALGLKHGHQSQNGFPVLPADYDALEYSLMTYRSFVGGEIRSYTYSEWSAPQTYMMADIAALQHLYGADFTTNAGNTVYSWLPSSGDTLVNSGVAIDVGGSEIFATIWDGGGEDTYDLSAYSVDVSINLAPGASSAFDAAQRANLGFGHFAAGNIYNALQYEGDVRSLIENATGGAGNDIIRGNAADNVLVGGDGSDTLRGANGIDKLSGQGGNDTLTGGAKKDVFRFWSADGHDVVADFTAGEDRCSFEGFGLNFSSVMALATQIGGDTIITIDASTSVTLEDVLKSSLSADDFRFVL